MSFSFGTPSSAPASGLSGGFSFGANKPATPGFGLGTTPQASTGLFGSTPAAAAPAFGSTPSFGGGTSTAPSFGSTGTPAFGSSATPAFGSTAAPAFGATTSAPSFGTAAPSFGSTAPSFGTGNTSFGAGNTSFGTGLGTGGLNFGTGTSTTTATTGLSFGAPAVTTASAGLGGFGFGTNTSTTQSGLGFGTTTTSTTNSAGLFGAKPGGLNLTAPSASAAPSLGLGGQAPTTSTTAAGDGKNEPPKQTKLPNEIATTVDSFKEFVKKQKSMSSEVMRVSSKPLHKVSRCAEEMSHLVVSLRSEVSRGRSQSRRLRALGADAVIAAEKHADSTGLELDNSAPPAYIKMLIAELEQQLITFRRQMDLADKQMQAAPKLLTEQELTLGIRRMHESLVALAGRLQNVHSQVEAQKEQYLNLRKYILKDPTNVFEKQNALSSFDQILRDSESGAKKPKQSNYGDVTNSSFVLADPAAALGSVHRLAGPTPFSYIGSSLTSFNLGEHTNSNWQPSQPAQNTSLNTSGLSFGATDNNNTQFQLQKPPGKRGKQ